MKKQKINLIGVGVTSALALVAAFAPVARAEGSSSVFDKVEFADVKATADTTDVTLDKEVLKGSWGPQDRATYTMESPATQAVFNSITNATNSAGEGLGDERQFVRIYEIDPKAESYKAVQSLDLEAGKKYQVVIYYHNDASKSLNVVDGKFGKGIAANTKVATWFPRTMNKGDTGYVVGQITWTVAQPDAESQEPSATNPLQKVWASAKVTAKEDIKLEPIAGHALLVNKQNHGTGNLIGTQAQKDAGELYSPSYILSSSLFTATGTYIQSNHVTPWTVDGVQDGGTPSKNEDGSIKVDADGNTLYAPNGVVLGCDEYAGRVTYQFQTKAVTVPDELPSAGAMQIVLAGALLIVVAGGVTFMMKTHAATRSAKGKK